MHFVKLAIASLIGSASSSAPGLTHQRQAAQDQGSAIQLRVADVASIETALGTANAEVASFSTAISAFDGSTPENSLAFLTSFSRLGVSINGVSQTILTSGLLTTADSAAVYPDIAQFSTAVSGAVGGVTAKSGPIAAAGFGGVVCASLEALLTDVELLLETAGAVFDVSYESLVGVLTERVGVQFDSALAVYCPA